MKKLFLIVIIGWLVWAPQAQAQTLPGLPNLTPLIISNILTNNVSDTGATVTWATNLPATGVVEYGLTSSYGQSTGENQNLLLVHTATLSELEPGRTYHYRVSSTDILNMTQTSADQTFTTTCSSGCGESTKPPSSTSDDNSSTTNNYIFNNPAPTATTGNNQTTTPTTNSTPPSIQMPSATPAIPSSPTINTTTSSGSRPIAQRNPSSPQQVRIPILPVTTGQDQATSWFHRPNSLLEWLFLSFLLLLLLCGLWWATSPMHKKNFLGQPAVPAIGTRKNLMQ